MKVLLILERCFELRMLLISSVRRFAVALFSCSLFRSVSLPRHFRSALKKYMAFIQFLCSKFRPARLVFSIPLLQMCIGSYNFRIPAVEDCSLRLPSLAHKTTNCVPPRFYIFDVSFIFRDPDIVSRIPRFWRITQLLLSPMNAIVSLSVFRSLILQYSIIL